jgi:adenylate kinase
MGPPGSGKGVRARIMGKMFDIPVITAGDMLREATSRKTEQGLIAEGYMNSRPDVGKGFILDGFPRSMNQAVALDRILKKLDTQLDFVVTVVAKLETIVSRVSLRRICSKCGEVYHLRDIVPKMEGICDECGGRLIQREDDKEEIIHRRFEVYEKQTFPMIERYSTAGKLKEISGELEIVDIRSVLEKLLRP